MISLSSAQIQAVDTAICHQYADTSECSPVQTEKRDMWAGILIFLLAKIKLTRADSLTLKIIFTASINASRFRWEWIDKGSFNVAFEQTSRDFKS